MLEDTQLLSFYVGLTPRQRDVLKLTCQGLRNPEIAHRLVITPGVVAEHLSNIYGQLPLLDDSVPPSRYRLISLFAGFFTRYPNL